MTMKKTKTKQVVQKEPNIFKRLIKSLTLKDAISILCALAAGGFAIFTEIKADKKEAAVRAEAERERAELRAEADKEKAELKAETDKNNERFFELFGDLIEAVYKNKQEIIEAKTQEEREKICADGVRDLTNSIPNMENVNPTDVTPKELGKKATEGLRRGFGGSQSNRSEKKGTSGNRNAADPVVIQKTSAVNSFEKFKVRGGMV